MLDRLDKDCLDMERRRQSLYRIDPKRQVLAWGEEVKSMAMAAWSLIRGIVQTEKPNKNQYAITTMEPCSCHCEGQIERTVII